MSDDELMRQQIADAAHVFRAVMEAQNRGLRPLVLIATDPDSTNAFVLTARPKCNFEEVFDLIRNLIKEFNAGRVTLEDTSCNCALCTARRAAPHN